MTKNTLKSDVKAAGDKTRRFTKKTKPQNILCKQITHSSDLTGTSEEEKNLILDLHNSYEPEARPQAKSGKCVKRRKSAHKTSRGSDTPDSPVKRQKIREASNYIEDREKVCKPHLPGLKPLRMTKTVNKSKSIKSAGIQEVSTADTVTQQKSGSAITKIGSTSPRKEKGKRRNQKNPYLKIMNQLPQEIKEKLDWSKENLNDICSNLTPPNEDKPGLVLKWIRKVSENEFSKIREEVLSIKIDERRLKRSLYLSYDELHTRRISVHSQRSESSSKNDSERYTAVKSRDTPNPVINYNVATIEGNSACSKTSAHTKPSPNLVRIPLSVAPDVSKGQSRHKKPVAVSSTKQPVLESVVPGKRVVLKFEAPKIAPSATCIELKCKRNILQNTKCQDIAIESVEDRGYKDIKYLAIPTKQVNEGHHSINILSSVGCDHFPESINFNWAMNNESQDLNCPEPNFIKPEVAENKYLDLDQSDLSQMMESEDDCDDYYLQKHLLPKASDPMKSFHMGEHSLINHFGINILESNDNSNLHIGVIQHMPPFACNADDVMMSIEDFKPSIDAHNQ